MDKLISNTDFGFYVRELDINDHKKLELRENYDSFLKQPLTLGMFVPTDLDGNVLEEPDFMSGEYDDNGFGDVDKYKYKKDLKEYQEAKERCLFENFEFNKILHQVKTYEPFCNICTLTFKLLKVEYLVKYNLVLTESAKKQIGL